MAAIVGKAPWATCAVAILVHAIRAAALVSQTGSDLIALGKDKAGPAYSDWTLVAPGTSCTAGCIALGTECDASVPPNVYAQFQSTDDATAVANAAGESYGQIRDSSCRDRGIEPAIYASMYIQKRCNPDADPYNPPYPSVCSSDNVAEYGAHPSFRRICPCRTTAYNNNVYGTGGDGAATGDPHLMNIYGERFDLMKPGVALLISIPRGAPAHDALLTVTADAHQMGGYCADTYFQTLNITGAWAEKVQSGGFTFEAQGARDEMRQMPTWTKLGPLELKVIRGTTDTGIHYLNFYSKHLGHAGFAVGGLLGQDDHTEAAMPAAECRRTITLSKRAESKVQHVPKSTAVATV